MLSCTAELLDFGTDLEGVSTPPQKIQHYCLCFDDVIESLGHSIW